MTKEIESMRLSQATKKIVGSSVESAVSMNDIVTSPQMIGIKTVQTQNTQSGQHVNLRRKKYIDTSFPTSTFARPQNTVTKGQANGAPTTAEDYKDGFHSTGFETLALQDGDSDITPSTVMNQDTVPGSKFNITFQNTLKEQMTPVQEKVIRQHVQRMKTSNFGEAVSSRIKKENSLPSDREKDDGGQSPITAATDEKYRRLRPAIVSVTLENRNDVTLLKVSNVSFRRSTRNDDLRGTQQSQTLKLSTNITNTKEAHSADEHRGNINAQVAFLDPKTKNTIESSYQQSFSPLKQREMKLETENTPAKAVMLINEEGQLGQNNDQEEIDCKGIVSVKVEKKPYASLIQK